jgi:hypothetical protein
MSRLIPSLGALCAFILIGGLQAADHAHHDAHDLLKKAGHKPNATHQLHGNIAGHSVHATTNGAAKVHSMHAMNGARKVNPTKLVKSSKKYHAGLGPNGEYHFVSTDEETEGCQNVQWVGFWFNLGGQIYIFWFPVNIVSVDLSLCFEYVG